MATIFASDMQWSSANLNLHISAGSKIRLGGGNSLILLYCGLSKKFLLITQVVFFVEPIKNLISNMFKTTSRFPLEQAG